MSDYGIGFKKPNTLERSGVVVDSINRGEVAGVVFTSYRDILYLIPSNLLKQVDKKTLAAMSKSQRQRLHQNFIVGDNVEFEANSNGIITWICKSITVREINLSTDGKFVFSTKGIVSDDFEPQIWTESYGYVKSKGNLLNNIMSNVPLKFNVELDLDYGQHEGRMEFYLSNFRPKFSFFLHSVLGVSLDFHLLHNAPWNKEKKISELNKSTYASFSNADFFEGNIFIEALPSKADKTFFKNVKCIAISKMELYSKQFPKQKVKIAYHPIEEEEGFVVGALLSVHLYSCPINNCLIAHDFAVEGSVPVKVDDHWKHKFLTTLTFNSKEQKYLSEVFGDVSDPYGLIPVRITGGQSTEAWVAPQNADDKSTKYLSFIAVHVGNKKARINTEQRENISKSNEAEPILTGDIKPVSTKEFTKDFTLAPTKDSTLTLKKDFMPAPAKDSTTSDDAAHSEFAIKSEIEVKQVEEAHSLFSKQDLLAELRKLDYCIIKTIADYPETYEMMQNAELLEQFLSVYRNVW